MKDIEQMNEDEFLSWATGYFVISLGQGEKLKSILWFILTNNTIRLNHKMKLVVKKKK